jgi:hypothetical protein
MAFQALAAFSSWSASRKTTERLLSFLLCELARDLHLSMDEEVGAVLATAKDDSCIDVDQNRFAEALDTLVALVVEDRAMEHEGVRHMCAALLEACSDYLTEDHLAALDKSSSFKASLEIVSPGLQGRVASLGDRFWQSLVHDVMFFAQPCLAEWASKLVSASGVVFATPKGGPDGSVGGGGPARDSAAVMWFLVGRSSPFQQLLTTLEQSMLKWGLPDQRDRLIDSALQMLIDVVAEETSSLNGPALCDENEQRGLGLLRLASERQHMAEHMLLVIQCNEDSSDGDVVRFALDLAAVQKPASDNGGVAFEVWPGDLPFTRTCQITLRCASAQLRFARTIFLAAEAFYKVKGSCGGTTCDDDAKMAARDGARARLALLLEWFAACHPDDWKLSALQEASPSASLPKAALGGAIPSSPLYTSPLFIERLASLCDHLSCHSQEQSALGPQLRLRLQPPARFCAFAELFPPTPSAAIAFRSGAALLCSAYLLCCCLNPSLAVQAKWFARAVPRVYLNHPVATAAANGFLQGRVVSDFYSEEIYLLATPRGPL